MKCVRNNAKLLTSAPLNARLNHMMTDDQIAHEKAMVLFERAFRLQLEGQYGDAIMLYKRSIETHPTAEAYTYLGWTYGMMERREEAIEMCQKAIAIDPTYGNPYNDIGVYLMEDEQWEEAIGWLEKALATSRYDTPQFAWMNLAHVHEQIGHYRTALKSYDQALAIDPLYFPAEWNKALLLGKMN